MYEVSKIEFIYWQEIFAINLYCMLTNNRVGLIVVALIDKIIAVSCHLCLAKYSFANTLKITIVKGNSPIVRIDQSAAMEPINIYYLAGTSSFDRIVLSYL